MSSADYVIVGAGSAGCVLAARLSEDTGASVVLLEAGGEADSVEVDQPSTWPMLWNQSENWGYVTASQAGFGFRSIAYPRGKGLGGTSAINAMIYARGDPNDFDTWRALGNSGWGWEDVLPYFRKLEDHPFGPADLYGRGGPLSISPVADPHPSSSAFVEAAGLCGHMRFETLLGTAQCGAGLWGLTVRDGRRCSAAKAYLRPAASRSNLSVRPRAHALRLLLDADRATGVEYFDGKQVRRVLANREVIVCAGTIDSPKLLMLSGVGDPAQLEAHGIRVKHALPGVGANLHDHAATALVLLRHKPGRAASTSNLAEAGLFMRVDHDKSEFGVDIQMFFSPLAPPTLAVGSEAPAMLINVQPCRPLSRGRLTLRSSNPLDAPVIDPAYLTHAHDLRLHLEGLRAAREIAASEPLRAHIAQELSPGPAVVGDIALERAVRATAACVWHPVGTCRMGSDEQAVVDSQLRVCGLRSLRVVDASVMPQITSSNTNAPTLMLAERAAEFIRESH